MRTMERRNLELEQKFRKQFTRRCWFFLFVTILLYLILASRFAYLQIFQYDELVTKAEANRKTETAHPPRRGIIMDKNGEVLATNDPIYTLDITPAKTPNFNQTLKELQKVISISKGDIAFILQERMRHMSSATSDESLSEIRQDLKRAAEETITRGHSISAKRVLSFRTKTYCTASPDSSKSRYALPAARSDLYR